jgi:uncharacterized protein (TIGR02147 family)
MVRTFSTFEFQDYREFLRALAGPKGTRHGVRQSMARAIPVHSSYLTKVLDGGANLSLEQGLKLAGHLGLDAEETEYFLLLLQQARAGTRELGQHFLGKLEAIRSRRLQLKERVPIRKTLSREDQSQYYSSWRFAAVHMALTVPALRTRAALARFLGLSEESVAGTLEFLVSAGLAEREGGQFLPGRTLLHLEGDSPNIFKHHVNWRTRALAALDEPRERDLHYSAVMSLSRAAADELREKLVRAVRECIAHAAEASPEEEVFGFTVDWFNLAARTKE